MYLTNEGRGQRACFFSRLSGDAAALPCDLRRVPLRAPRAKARSGWTARQTEVRFAPGHFLFFKRGTVHALPEIIEAPVVFLSVDTPRRDPKDIIFVNPEDGSPDSFIQGQKK